MSQTLLLTPPSTRDAVPACRSTLLAFLPRDRNWGFVLAIPMLLWVFTSPDFFYDPPGYLDAFYYQGYFLHYTKHLPHFDGDYKVSRLPWVLPGWVCYQVLGVHTGHLVLHLGTLLFALSCLYLLVRDSLDGASALVATALLGTCIWFHGSGGWNYHMTATTAYFLLATLALQRASVSGRPGWWHFLAGATAAACIHTHLFCVVLMPGLLWHGWLTGRLTWRQTGRALVWGLAGAGALTALLVVVYRATGGKGWFFVPQIRHALKLAQLGNSWHRADLTWLLRATWLVPALSVVMALVTTGVLLRRRGVRRPQLLVVCGFQGQALLAIAIALYYQFIKMQTILDHDYMAGFMLAPIVLGMSGFVHVALGDRFRGKPGWLGVASLGAFAGLLLGPAGVWNWLREFSAAAPIVAPAILAVSGVAVLAGAGRNTAGLLAGLTLLSLANCCSVVGPLKYSRYGSSLKREMFDFSLEADAFFTALDPTMSAIRFWSDPAEHVSHPPYTITVGSYVASFVATHAWTVDVCPPLDQLDRRFLHNSPHLALVSRTDTHEQLRLAVAERLAQQGYRVQEKAARDFSHGLLALSTTVWSISRSPAH